jgi:anaerobic magnesium-protoporphyrin IX monomethyl ester cyclase
MTLDILFINPADHNKIYQGLAEDYSAIETPTWCLLLAAAMRSKGYNVEIFDPLAERMTIDESVERIQQKKARLNCFVVYGQNPNSGTVNMHGAALLSQALKLKDPHLINVFVGSHMSAIPLEVLEDEKSIDIVLTNEGVYAIENLLKLDSYGEEALGGVKGIGFRKKGIPFLTFPERIVPQDKMDIDLPGYAWDLLPYKNQPLDLYRAHFWHAEYKHEKRTPFAAIYTSLGCQFGCDFCMINILNRDDNEPIGVAANYSKMRFWSPEFIIKEFDKLYEMGVRTLRISDEMFLLNKKFYVPLCELLIERGYGEDLNMWAYSRVDTIKTKESLDLIRSAGIRWLALGIESGNRNIRLKASKGKFEDVDISDVIKKVHDADIEVIANYLFGLPGDDMDSMQTTLDLSFELNTAAWNAYPVMALPGSTLYKKARDEGITVPQTYSGYSFHAEDTLPLPTKYLSPGKVLKFRDEAFLKYHSHKPFLDRIEKKWGRVPVENIKKLTTVKLKRNIK